ncbi:MAG: flagellar biosynthetic protein FliO [Lachnospiraceae bacterium]|nr:flagellar biosynthetic protein FliO [Lachnospiraceae bacterium]
MVFTVVSKIDSVVQFLTVLVIFVFVLGATWFTTRYIAGFQKGKMRGNNFESIDSFRISQNKYIQIIRIGERYLAIAVCKDTVTVLAELQKDEIIYPEDLNMGTPIQFEEFLNRAKGLIHKADMKAADKHEEDN